MIWYPSASSRAVGHSSGRIRSSGFIRLIVDQAAFPVDMPVTLTSLDPIPWLARYPTGSANTESANARSANAEVSRGLSRIGTAVRGLSLISSMPETIRAGCDRKSCPTFVRFT
jgi:hypothetical protein